jgi:hypothetical protein
LDEPGHSGRRDRGCQCETQEHLDCEGGRRSGPGRPDAHNLGVRARRPLPHGPANPPAGQVR